MKKLITKEEKENLIKDIKSGKLNSKQLVLKYNYASIPRLNGSIFWWKKQGVLTDQDVLHLKRQKKHVKNLTKTYFSVSKKAEIYKKHNSNLYNNTQLAEMYGLPSANAVCGLIARFKKSKDFNKVKSENISTNIKVDIAPKIVNNSIRSINFPDGFVIQIEKAFISKVLIHENGNVTIIK